MKKTLEKFFNCAIIIIKMGEDVVFALLRADFHVISHLKVQNRADGSKEIKRERILSVHTDKRRCVSS